MNLIAAKAFGPLNPIPMAKQNEGLADRLVRIREYLGHETQAAMARALKISHTSWNNFERGYPVPITVAMKVKQAVPGMTLDWLYEGDPSKLPLDLAAALGELPEGAAPPSNATRAARRG